MEAFMDYMSSSPFEKIYTPNALFNQKYLYFCISSLTFTSGRHNLYKKIKRVCVENHAIFPIFAR